jgi:hypothetical protein
MISCPIPERFNKIREPLLSPIRGARGAETFEIGASENLIKHGGAFGILCIRATCAQKYSVSARGPARIGADVKAATAAASGGGSA